MELEKAVNELSEMYRSQTKREILIRGTTIVRIWHHTGKNVYTSMQTAVEDLVVTSERLGEDVSFAFSSQKDGSYQASHIIPGQKDPYPAPYEIKIGTPYKVNMPSPIVIKKKEWGEYKKNLPVLELYLSKNTELYHKA